MSDPKAPQPEAEDDIAGQPPAGDDDADCVYVDEDGNPIDVSSIDLNSGEYEVVEEEELTTDERGFTAGEQRTPGSAERDLTTEAQRHRGAGEGSNSFGSAPSGAGPTPSELLPPEASASSAASVFAEATPDEPPRSPSRPATEDSRLKAEGALPQPSALSPQPSVLSPQPAPVAWSAPPPPKPFEVAPTPPRRSPLIVLSVLAAACILTLALVVSWLLTREGGSDVPAPGPEDTGQPVVVDEPGPKPPVVPVVPDVPRPPAPVTIAVEAESGVELVAPLQVIADGEASGGRCLTLPAASCNDGQHVHPVGEGGEELRMAGMVQIPFTVEQEGKYCLWIRKWWCCAEGDSFIIELDGGRSYVFGNSGAGFRQWSWLSLRETGQLTWLDLTPGRHVLLIRSSGDTGFKIDKLILTTDAETAPEELAPEPKG